LSGQTLYGTTTNAGSGNFHVILGSGELFKVGTDGSGFTGLHGFPPVFSGSNADGAMPNGSLVLSGTTLYGTAIAGGAGNSGTIFAVNTDGSGFTNLHNFAGASDGANPYAGLLLAGGTLYGTAKNGGTSSDGALFAMSTNGTGFMTLRSFTGANGANPAG